MDQDADVWCLMFEFDHGGLTQTNRTKGVNAPGIDSTGLQADTLIDICFSYSAKVDI